MEYDEGEATPNATPLFELGHVHKFANLDQLESLHVHDPWPLHVHVHVVTTTSTIHHRVGSIGPRGLLLPRGEGFSSSSSLVRHS